MRHYTIEEIQKYLEEHSTTPEMAVEWLNTPYIMFGDKTAMDLYNDDTDDYSGDIMGCFRRVFG